MAHRFFGPLLASLGLLLQVLTAMGAEPLLLNPSLIELYSHQPHLLGVIGGGEVRIQVFYLDPAARSSEKIAEIRVWAPEVNDWKVSEAAANLKADLQLVRLKLARATKAGMMVQVSPDDGSGFGPDAIEITNIPVQNQLKKNSVLVEPDQVTSSVSPGNWFSAEKIKIFAQGELVFETTGNADEYKMLIEALIKKAQDRECRIFVPKQAIQLAPWYTLPQSKKIMKETIKIDEASCKRSLQLN